MSFYTIAQNPLFSTYKDFIDLSQKNYQTKLSQLQKEPDNLDNLKDINSIEFDPDFLGHIIFFTPSRYLALTKYDLCSFYDLILAGEVRDFGGPINYAVLRYINNKDARKLSYVTLDTFLKKVVSKKCPKSSELKNYFEISNFSLVAKKIQLKPPRTMGQCENSHDKFINDPKSIYMCSISDKVQKIPELEKELKLTARKNFKKIQILKSQIREAKAYEKQLNKTAIEYLANICLNIEKPKVYCHQYFSRDYWGRILNKELDPIYAKALCEDILDVNSLNQNAINSCLLRIKTQKQLCSLQTTKYPSLFPKPNCDQLSRGLSLSNLNTKYQDCPALMGNEYISNTARILHHFTPFNNKAKTSSCSLLSAKSFVDFSLKTNTMKNWNVSLCYDDKINEQEVCLPVINGYIENSEYSLEKVVTAILYKTKGTSKEMKCEVTKREDYNPNILKYKNGCYILYEKSLCSAVDCDIEIILDERKITHIRSKQNNSFHYFPTSYQNERTSISGLISEDLKKKQIKIINTTQLENLFAQHANMIVHGVGCVEDLLPSYYKKSTFAQCSPVSFIISGFIKKRDRFSMITTVSLDDIHSPRVIPWPFIFTAVKTYQEQHPSNLWGLYALY